MLKYIENIHELSRSNVYIKNKVQVNNVIQNLITDGKSKLQIISDFDKTITKQYEDGKAYVSSFGVFTRCPSITPDYYQQAIKLTTTYQPIELDPNIPIPEKKLLVGEWYTKLGQAIIGQTVSTTEIEKTACELGPALRNGTVELLTDLHQHKIPVSIFSAGLGDSVKAILKNSNVWFPNIEIISNFLKYTDGIVKGFKNDTTVHIYNKNEFILNNKEYYNMIKHRQNIILMGDSLGDCEMADSVPNMKNILKIGFLYEHAAENLPKYMDKYDIVLEDDQTMDVVRSILKCVLG